MRHIRVVALLIMAGPAVAAQIDPQGPGHVPATRAAGQGAGGPARPAASSPVGGAIAEGQNQPVQADQQLGQQPGVLSAGAVEPEAARQTAGEGWTGQSQPKRPVVGDAELRPLGQPTRLEPVPTAGPSSDSSATRAGPAAGAASDARGRDGSPGRYAEEAAARGLTLPEGNPIAGQPVTLLEAIATSGGGHPRRLQLVRAYWTLAEAVARYRCRWDVRQRLAALQPRSGDSLRLQAARADAEAAMVASWAEVIQAQHALAELMGLPNEAPLPLPVNRPHVGSYRTYFEELFRGTPAPWRLRVINELLPLRKRQIEARAEAVRSSAQVAEGSSKSYVAGQRSLYELVADFQRWTDHRLAFFAAVADYNRQIAEYALAVANPAAAPEALVAMLIKVPAGVPHRAPPLGQNERDSDVLPAGGFRRALPAPHAKRSPAEVEQANPLRADTAGQPTLAPLRQQIPLQKMAPEPATGDSPEQPSQSPAPDSSAAQPGSLPVLGKEATGSTESPSPLVPVGPDRPVAGVPAAGEAD